MREHVWSFSLTLGLYSALQLDAAFFQSFAHFGCCSWTRPARGDSFDSPEWRLSGASVARCLEPRDNRGDCALAKGRGLLSSGSSLAAFGWYERCITIALVVSSDVVVSQDAV